MTTRYKDDVKKLFEFWCELAAPERLGEPGRLISSFPEEFDEPQLVDHISNFAYPCELPRTSIFTFSFVLTTIDSKWRFGFCRHDQRNRTAMVVLTYLPWNDVFTKFVNVLGELRATDQHEEFAQFLREAYVCVPEPGACLKLYYRAGTMNFMFQRPAQFMLPSIPENNNLNMYYNFVRPKYMIEIFAAMLSERRIVFTSDHLDRLSACVQAANSLLYPMVWEHIFIPILPEKMRDTLGATMPFLIGVPLRVLKDMRQDELGDVVIFELDSEEYGFQSQFNDVKSMPADLVSQLKKHLSTNELVGNRVSKIFLGVLVQLIGGYRDGIKFSQGEKFSFDGDLFLESKSPQIRTFLRKLMQSQLFQQFIDGRLQMLETGQGISDEFEMETIRYSEKMMKKGKPYKELFRNVKDKTNPAVKSAVQSVKQGSRGVKAAYKDLRSKMRDKPDDEGHMSHHHHQINHHHFDPSEMAHGGGGNSATTYSAPNSPMKPSLSTENNTANLRTPLRTGSLANTPVHRSGVVIPGDSISLQSLRLHDQSSSSGQRLLYPVTSDASLSSVSPDSSFDSPPEMPSPPVPPRQAPPQRPPPPSSSTPNKHHQTSFLSYTTTPQHLPPPRPSSTNLLQSSPRFHSYTTATSQSHCLSAVSVPLPTPKSVGALDPSRTSNNGFESNFADVDLSHIASNTTTSSLSQSSSAYNHSEPAKAAVTASPLIPLARPSAGHNPEKSQPSIDQSPASPNLITLDTSFELEDFDPLNKNAKTLPPVPTMPSQSISAKMFAATAPNGGSQQASFNYMMGNSPYNPVYPSTYISSSMSSAQPQAPPRRKEIDADADLLRQYGLDGLIDSTAAPVTSTPQTNGSGTARNSRKDWTDFD